MSYMTVTTVTSLVTHVMVIITISYNIEKDIEDSRMNDIITTESQHIGLIYNVSSQPVDQFSQTKLHWKAQNNG